MSGSRDYFDRHAGAFFAATAGVDMSDLYAPFLSRLPKGGHILDAGCGSGRDAKFFSERGYRVTAFDASEELAARASHHCGFHVSVRIFADVHERDAYDGICCCASLLHVPASDMQTASRRLWREGTAFIGSSNISQLALQSGLEWNYRIVYPGDAGYLDAQRRFDDLFCTPAQFL